MEGVAIDLAIRAASLELTLELKPDLDDVDGVGEEAGTNGCSRTNYEFGAWSSVKLNVPSLRYSSIINCYTSLKILLSF
jgi:hypothetical protein